MSEDSKILTIKFELPQIVNQALAPLATTIGTTLSHGWEGLTLGIDLWYGKKKLDYQKNLELYAKQIQDSISEIPENELQEPKMNILGPALDASKFYFEEEQYRDMFSKLVARSFDKRFNSAIHPFFVEAIKQMKPLDAELMIYFGKAPGINYPIVNHILRDKDNSIEYLNKLVFLIDEPVSPKYYSASITNLIRLGLIDVSFTSWLKSVNAYLLYEMDPHLALIKEEISHNSEFDNLNVEFEKGLLFLTPLGKDFVSICI